MIRGTKVGDVVEVRPMKGWRLDGTIIDVLPDASPPLRCVATLNGHHWVSPDEMWPSEAEDHTKPVEALVAGDMVILPLGTRRLVSDVQLRQQTVHLTFDVPTAQKGWWPRTGLARGTRICVVSPDDDATA